MMSARSASEAVASRVFSGTPAAGASVDALEATGASAVTDASTTSSSPARYAARVARR